MLRIDLTCPSLDLQVERGDGGRIRTDVGAAGYAAESTRVRTWLGLTTPLHRLYRTRHPAAGFSFCYRRAGATFCGFSPFAFVSLHEVEKIVKGTSDGKPMQP